MTTGTASHVHAGDDSVAPVRPGELVADKYLVQRTLGVGGMGVVVAARDRVLDRPVAIKFLLPKLAGSDTSVQRFVREARAATRVTSEHVVRLLEIDKLPSGTPFFVMEYLEGSDLRGYLREHGPLEPRRAVDYALQALQAVAEGHLKGIVHRDIKPGNLFLTTRADGTALIKVLDFGIAKTLESEAAESTSLTSSDDVRLGSPAYMPPEQLQNPRDVDTRSDIWSLGATLYELICGRPPFEGPGYLELASRILSSPPAPISQRDTPTALPPGLEQVLVKCLQKERRLRYANAAELATALAPFGTEDARVSLSRVTGMWGSSHSSPSSHHVLHDSGSVATTLTVAAEVEASRSSDKQKTSNIGPHLAPPRGRSWIVLASAAVVVLAVIGLSRRTPEATVATSAPPAIEAARAPVIAPQLSQSLPALAAPATPMQAVAEKAAPSAAKPAARPGRELEHTPPKAAPPPSAPASGATLPPPIEASTAPDAPPPNGLGRSAEIERLIEQRR